MGNSEVRVRLANTADAPCLSALATQVFFETYATSGIRPALAREAEELLGRADENKLFAKLLRNET